MLNSIYHSPLNYFEIAISLCENAEILPYNDRHYIMLLNTFTTSGISISLYGVL